MGRKTMALILFHPAILSMIAVSGLGSPMRARVTPLKPSRSYPRDSAKTRFPFGCCSFLRPSAQSASICVCRSTRR
jgi:hypothetical protein